MVASNVTNITNIKPSTSTNRESKTGKESGKRSKESTAKPLTLTMNHSPITLNSNTTTTKSTEIKSATIKIKPSQALSSKATPNHLPAMAYNGSKTHGLKSSGLSSVKRNHAAKRAPEEAKQNGSYSIGESQSFATGIRKEKKKKKKKKKNLLLTSNQPIVSLTNSLTNNPQSANKTKSNGITPTKSNQQVVAKDPKTSSPSKAQIINSNHHQLNSQRLGSSKHFLPCPAPEPTSALNLVGLTSTPKSSIASATNSHQAAVNPVLFTSSKQPAAHPKEALSIVPSKKDASPPKSTGCAAKQSVGKTSVVTRSPPAEQPEPQPLPSGKKTLKIDLHSAANSTSTPSAHKSCGSMRSVSVTITPIALNNSSTSAKERSSPSLTAVQLDTASMRAKPSGSCLEASTNNMLANQTGKSLEIHPCNFYSSGSNSAVVISPKKLVADPPSIAATSPASNPSPFKVNDANLEAFSSANEFSMKGSTKKAAKSGGAAQVKQASEKIEQALLVSHGWKFEGEPIKKMVMISVCGS